MDRNAQKEALNDLKKVMMKLMSADVMPKKGEGEIEVKVEGKPECKCGKMPCECEDDGIVSEYMSMEE